jgi:Na+/melibiose symporter-like transporter
MSKLTRKTILSYGIVSLPIGVIGVPMGIYLAPFYAGELGLSLAAIGTMLMLSRLSDFVTDPLIGLLSDRWRPGIGRRKVWLPIGTLVMMSGVYLLFRPPNDVGMLYFLIAVSMTYLGYTTLQLPYTAWGAELSPQYHIRTKITATAKFFDTSGLVISTIIPAYILSRAGATSGDIMDGISLFFLIALPLCATIAFINVPEPQTQSAAKTKINARQVGKLLMRNKPFALITIALFIATVAEVFRQTVTVFFAKEIIGVENVGTVYVYYFACALIMIPFWNRIATKLEKHRALALALCIVLGTNLCMYFLEAGQTTAFIVLFVIKGSCYGALAIFPGAMIADCADIDTALTGERQQGLFFAISTMLQKLGFAIGQGLPLVLLGYVGFNATGGNGPEELYWLSFIYGIAPAAVAGFAIAALIPYSLTAARHRELQDYLEKKKTDDTAILPLFLQSFEVKIKQANGA